mgnify:CR=1 FL=1
MNKSILKIAVPAILSNVIVPLLGLVDLTIAGHIGDAVTIGAVSVGATMFSLTYWNFGFLRMGTSGLTAQAYGARDRRQMSVMLFRSVALALLLGIAIVALQSPIRWLLLAAISPSEAVHTHASQYFSIIIWGAPATLATMSLTGWFIGMQNSTYPLAVSMVVNAVNIVCSLCFVFAMRLGFIGIPLGTLAAQWCGFILSAFFAARMMRKETLGYAPRVEEMLHGLGRFFSVNRDIFLRSLCVMAVMLFFTATGARSGNMTLAVNSLFMQLYLLYSHFMDGFAYAGEALVGKYAGAADKRSLHRCVSHLFAWGWSIAAIFAFAYGVFLPRSNVAVQRQARGRSVCRSLPMVDSPRSDSRYGGVHLGRRVCRTYRHPTDAVVARRRDSSLFHNLFSLSARRCQRLSMDGVFGISRRPRSDIMALFCP